VRPLLSGLAPLVAALVFAAAPKAAHAVRFSLGVGTLATPLAIEPDGLSGLRFGLRPILEVEPSPRWSFGVYTPFTLVRTGGASDAGAESIFGLSAAWRTPLDALGLSDEDLFYVAARPGLGTADGRAGLYLGGAVGVASTWQPRGVGLFVELEVGHVGIAEGGVDRPFPAVDRWLIGLAVGLQFKLAGEDWRIPRGDP
jgi:hypothetical protein